MKLVTYNIQFGRGKDERFDLERIAGEVAGADVIALQEVERFWQRSAMVDQPEVLAGLLGEHHWVYGPGVDLHAGEPGQGGGGRRRQFGNMLLAKRPILAARNHLLPKYASLGPLSVQRSALEGLIETGRGALRVYSVHLTHLSARTRLPQLETLLEVHRNAPIEGAPITGGDPKEDWLLDAMLPAMPLEAVLMGDFNAEPDSEEYERVVGPLSVYGGRIVNPHGFVDAWVEAGGDPFDGVTSDVKGRDARLDYCFVSASLRERIVSAHVDTAAQGSDHQPVWVELDLD